MHNQVVTKLYSFTLYKYFLISFAAFYTYYHYPGLVPYFFDYCK